MTAEQNNPLPLVIEAQQLQDALNTPALRKQLIILDLSTQELFELGHIPDAIFVNHKQLTCAQPPAPGKLPSLEQLSDLMSSIGLQDDKHVVVYDHEGGPWAGRFIWTLDLLGHNKYSFLNGGRDAWIAEKLDLSNQSSSATPSDYQAEIKNPEVLASKEEILAALDQIPESVAIWDARSADEHSGAKVLAARGGHIPGATHLEWTDTLNKNAFSKLHPAETLTQLLENKGLTKDKTIISHCQTHRRSGLTYLVAKYLGYPVNKAYDGSWSEWGNDPDTPVESD